MFVRKVKLMPSVFLAHAQDSATQPGKVSDTPRGVQVLHDSSELSRCQSRETVSGQLPTRIVISLVDNRAYNGDRQRNPFNFQHFNLNEIAVYLDGQQQHAVRPVQPDYGH